MGRVLTADILDQESHDFALSLLADAFGKYREDPEQLRRIVSLLTGRVVRKSMSEWRDAPGQ